MKYSDKQQYLGTVARRSSRVALSPYFIEDVAMTPGDLARARASDITVVVPR